MLLLSLIVTGIVSDAFISSVKAAINHKPDIMITNLQGKEINETEMSSDISRNNKPKPIINPELLNSKENKETPIIIRKLPQSEQNRVMTQTDQERIEKLESRLIALEIAYKNFQDNLEKIQAKFNNLQLFLKNQKIENQIKILNDQNMSLIKTLQNMEERRKHFFDSNMIRWFLAGMGIMFFGWLLGHGVSFRERN